MILSFLICLAAARNLHNKMFKAILQAPILFFDTNPVGMPYKAIFHYIIMLRLGRVLNRFSKDIGFMDDLLPFQFVELFSVSVITDRSTNSNVTVMCCCCLVTVEVYGYCSSSMRGKLLALHSCRSYRWSAAAVPLVLPAHLEAY